MPTNSETFVDYVTPVPAVWLNDVNQAIYQAIGTGGANPVAPTTPAQVVANLGIVSPLITVVTSIAHLRTQLKTGIGTIMVTGYYATGDGGGGLYYYNSTDVTSTDNGGTIIVASDGGRWYLTTTTATVSVHQFGAKGDGSTDDAPAIQAAINWFGTQNGGTITFLQKTYAIAETINITTSNIRLYGSGGSNLHDDGTGSNPSTVFSWIGSSGGNMIFVQTLQGTGNSIQTGIEVKNLELSGSAVAGNGMLIISVRECRFERIFVTNVTQNAFLVSTYARSTMAEASDTQRCVFSRCTWRMIDTATVQTANGFLLTAEFNNGTADANTSFNIFEYCEGQTFNGIGWILGDCDNNTLIGCGAIRVNGTGVPGLQISGDANYFIGFSCGGANGIQILVSGGGGFTIPLYNSFFAPDISNGTQVPFLGTGAKCLWLAPNNLIINGISTTNATAGSGSALPATPNGYLEVYVNSTLQKIPYYNL